MTSNLPPNLSEDFNDGPEMKVCPECNGRQVVYYKQYESDICHNCNGEGQIEITPEDKEDEQEKKSGLYYQ